MGNQVATLGNSKVSLSTSLRTKVKLRVKSSRPFRRVVSPSSTSSPLHAPHQHKRKRRSRSQSEGVTSDCSTAISAIDLPRNLEKPINTMMGPLNQSDVTAEDDDGATSLEKPATRNEQETSEQSRRIREAEKILVEIAKEYAAKRAAGLVPTKPVPARTLIWEEMERRAQRIRTGIGHRGVCLYGRDSETGACGCSTYKKLKRLPDGGDNTGGVCECCHHGAVWHRLTGGTTAAPGSGTSSSLETRRISVRSRSGQEDGFRDSVLGSDYYDEYDEDYSENESSQDEEEEDDEAIANEVARPYSMMDDPTPPLTQRQARSEGDRTSLFSNGDSFGLPPRLSSTSRHLDKLLSAIAKYRALGFSEDEIEMKLREDFPPTEKPHDRTTRASQ